MTFLNFIDTGFIITLALLILVSSGIMLYCYRRLNLLENTIIDHGKILQQFILNYNNQNSQNIVNSQHRQEFHPSQDIHPRHDVGGQVQDSHLTEDSHQTRDRQDTNINNSIETKTINLENKIIVSDEEESCSDSGDEESDDEECEDYNHDIEAEDLSNINNNNIIALKKYNNSDSNSEDSDDDDDDIDGDDDEDHNKDNIRVSDKIELIDIKQAGGDDEISLSNSLEFFTEININNKMFNTGVEDNQKFIKLIDDTKLMNNITLENEKNGKKSLTRLKVDELRTLAVTKNLTNIDQAQNMKKTDLIKLLQI